MNYVTIIESNNRQIQLLLINVPRTTSTKLWATNDFNLTDVIWLAIL